MVSAHVWQGWPSVQLADPIRQGGGFSVRIDLARMAIRCVRRPDPAEWRVLCPPDPTKLATRCVRRPDPARWGVLCPHSSGNGGHQVCSQTRSGKVGGSESAQIRQQWPPGVFAGPIRQGGGICVRQVWPPGVFVDPTRQGEWFNQSVLEV